MNAAYRWLCLLHMEPDLFAACRICHLFLSAFRQSKQAARTDWHPVFC